MPAVNIRENFFTEQIEILKGPTSTIETAAAPPAARSTSSPNRPASWPSFYNTDTKFASDFTRRVTFDVNQVITPTLAVRMDGMWQREIPEHNPPRRPLGRLGGGEVDADQQFHAVGELHPHQSVPAANFGVPYNTVAGAPVTSVGIPRQTYYGFVDRDFQSRRGVQTRSPAITGSATH